MENIVGERIKKLRDEAGLSQREVAEMLTARGYSHSQASFSHIEVGRNQPTVLVLLELARIFDTTVDYLLGMTDNAMSSDDIEEELRRGGLGGRLGETFKTLSKEHQLQILTIAETLAEIDERDQSALAEDQRFLSSLLDILERRFGEPAAALVLDDLAMRFPTLRTLLQEGGSARSGKQKAG